MISRSNYYQQFEHNGRSVSITFAQGADDLANVKKIDDLVFGCHHGVTMTELEELLENGFILMMHDLSNGRLIGETQILFNQIPELPHRFEIGESYCYGIGIVPDYQGQGLGKRLAMEQERLSLLMDASTMRMTVRVENYPSLRLMLRLGHHIYGYSPDFYGPNDIDARLLLEKNLHSHQVLNDEMFVHQNGEVLVPVGFGEIHDHVAHKHISNLISEGYKGIWINHSGIFFGK